MDSNPIKVIDKLLTLNICQCYNNIQVAQADLQDVGLASKVVDNIPVMVVQKLNNSVNIQPTYLQAFKLAGMGKKILSRKDHNQKDCDDKNEDGIAHISINQGNDGSELNPWKEQRKKSVQKPKETVQLSLFNRFSFWEDVNESKVEAGSDDEDGKFDKDCSDQLTCSPKVVVNKWKVVERQSKRQKVISKKDKKHCESIETNDSFNVFQSLIPKSKSKCRKCGYKKNCMKTNSCQAEDKFCSFCRKLNHYPQSHNCKKKRKLNQKKKKKIMTRFGCQTLREFLVAKAFKLSSYNIPYDDLLKIQSHNCKLPKSQQLKCNNTKNWSDTRTVDKINQKIKFLEGKLQFEKLLETVSKGTQFFLGAYILYNLQFFLLDNLKRNPHISENGNKMEKDMELSDEVEHFLEISSNTSYCVENYVEGQFDLEKHTEPGLGDCLSTGNQLNTKADVLYIKETAIRKKD